MDTVSRSVTAYSHTWLNELISQHGLDIGLGCEQDKGELSRWKVKVMKIALGAPSIAMDLQRHLGETPFQQRVRNAEGTQHLHRAWLYGQCRRPWSGLGSQLDYSDLRAQET